MIRTVSTRHFVECMEKRWIQFDNIPNEALRKSWGQLCDTFNDQIRSATDPEQRNRWRVLQSPTGTGKTEGTITYAALLAGHSSQPHGTLIVTKRIVDADRIAKSINELSGVFGEDRWDGRAAISYHSEIKGRIRVQDLANHPVLVTTHKGYTMALDSLNLETSYEGTWSYLSAFKGGERDLVVVDETINLIDDAMVNADTVDALLRICQPLKAKFPHEVAFLETLRYLFTEMEKRRDVTRESILLKTPLHERMKKGVTVLYDDFTGEPIEPDAIQLPDFAALLRDLRRIRVDKFFGVHDEDYNRRVQKVHGNSLSAIDALLKGHLYWNRTNNKPTFNTARLLVPPGAKGAVILDATASCNPIYDLFEDATVIVPPSGTRDYSNVTIHVSYGHKVGQREMRENAKELSKDLIATLQDSFGGQDRDILIGTHKDVEPFLKQYSPHDFKLNVGHWGATDGSNEWKDSDTVVVFGLPYKPNAWTANVFMAFQGVPEDASWLHDPQQRKFKQHNDIRKALSTGQMVSDIVQFINRGRSRKVIDDHGNCPSMDAYLLLPPQSECSELLRGILVQMPGAMLLEDWDYSGMKQKTKGRRPNRGNYDDSLVSYLSSMKENTVLKGSEVKNYLSIPEASWCRITDRLRDSLTMIR